ncbi:hypothetical protein NUU61_000095, partial [Penicillium alfredii]
AYLLPAVKIGLTKLLSPWLGRSIPLTQRLSRAKMSTEATPPQGVEPTSAPTPQSPRGKLLGRQFYESLGSPKYILAPMVDRSEFAWRMLTRTFMPPNEPKPILAYSPMYHARLFGEQERVRAKQFQPTREVIGDKNNSLFLDGNPTFDRPLFVQFCANDPSEFLEAARHVAPYCDAVDLNLGCPQGIAKKGHYGAFLQEDWDLIYKLINRLYNELSVPITAKFRIQESKEKTLNWDYVRYLRDNLPPETVIFANGNILNHDDLERCLEATGADGVMSAEGNLSDPTIFSKPPAVGTNEREYWRGRDGKGGYRIDAILRRYLDIIYKYVLEQPIPERKPLFLPSDPVDATEESSPEETEGNGKEEGPPKKKQKRDKTKRPNSPSLGVMQGHLFQVLRPMVASHTNVRDALARSRPGDMAAFEHVLTLVEQAVKSGLKEYETTPEKFEKHSDENLTGSKAIIAEYGRPFWICQPHVRPLPEEAVENGALQAKGKAAPKDEKPEAQKDTQDTNTPASERTGTPADGKTDTSATLTPDPL